MSENLELMGAIAKAIFNSDELIDINWESVSVIFKVDDNGKVNGTYGYAYDRTGTVTAIAPRPRDINQPVADYREWLRLEGDKGFIKMLFQFNRTTRQVKAEFEYEDPLRWKITPGNVDEMIKVLRPRFDD